MSKGHLSWTIAIAAVAATCYLSMSVLPRTVLADPVLPGGRAAKIRSYTAEGAGNQWFTIIPVVEGENGMVLTDFAVSGTESANRVSIEVGQGGTWQAVFGWHNYPQLGLSTVSLTTGIPIPPGATVRARHQANSAQITVAGYTW